MSRTRVILPLSLVLLAGSFLFHLRLGDDIVRISGISGNPVDVELQATEIPGAHGRRGKAEPEPMPLVASQWESLARALDRGHPVSLQKADGQTETYWMRPKKATTPDFQVTIGTKRKTTLQATPWIYEGHRFSDDSRESSHFEAPTTFVILGDSFAAVIQEPDGTVREISTDPESGLLKQRVRHGHHEPYTCSIDPRTRIYAVSSKDPQVLAQESPTEPVDILMPQPLNGQDPASGNYSKLVDSIVGGYLYEASLKEAMMLVVMDKEATGSEAIGNLTGKASVQLCRMASISTMYEDQIGTRVLVQELIMTPNTNGYDDIPSSLNKFRDWAETQRPRNNFPRTLATKVGDGLDGSTLGLAFIGTLKGNHGYSIVRPGYDHALLGHEMGHNFGSGHSDGGVMNASWKRSERNFFRKVNGGETSAKKIYSHAKSRLNGPAILRHPEEIPFSSNDFARTDKNTPVTLEPLSNDKTSVVNGKENRLRIAELGPVFPIDAGIATLDGGEVTFTPANDFTGIAWFSYTLKGDVGNNGLGWLHKGDIAIQVKSAPDNLKLTLKPGDSHIHHPSGNGDLTVKSQPGKARVDRSGDDKKAMIIRVNANASGTDSFVYRKDNKDYTVEITYAEPGPVTRPDIFVFDTTQETLRFNPLHNDEIPGTRNPQPIRPTLGVGTSGKGTQGIELYPNGFQLLNVKLLDSSKGSLSAETRPFFVNAQKVSVKNGFLKFEPKADAKGIARIEYTVADAAGNQRKETVAVLLPLVTITSPSVDTAIIYKGSGLVLEGTTHATSEPPLSGTLSTLWSVRSKPKNSSVTLDDAQSAVTGAQFSHTGTYVLRLTASDQSGYGTFDEVTIQVDHIGEVDDPDDQPVAWWKLNENRTNNLSDSSGNGFQGLRNGARWMPGIQGSCLEFDGLDDYADLLLKGQVIAANAIWKYLDSGNDPGATWKDVSFDDSSWKSGAAQLGYGNDGEATTLSFGGNSRQKHAAYYFRHSFELPGLSGSPPPSIRFQRDDSAALYLNGQEIHRDTNLAANATHLTYATSTIGNESEWKAVSPGPGLLQAGTNVISAEVHQASGTSSDTRFSLEMEAQTNPFDQLMKLSQGSISLWLQTTDESRMTLVSAADASDPDREWKLYMDEGRVHYQVEGDSGTDPSPFMANKKISDGAWHHVVLKIDPASNAVFYIDGKWTAKDNRPFLNVVDDINTLQFGRSLTSTGASDHFKGRIDDVRFHARALLQKEIDSLSHTISNRGPVITLPESKVQVPLDPFPLTLLNPKVDDDGGPSPLLQYEWSLLSTEGSLAFDNPRILAPVVDFNGKTTYHLRLTADDGQVKTFRDLEIEHVEGGNQKPMVLGIADLNLNENADAQVIDLYSAFEDMQDSDSNLVFTIIGNTNPDLFKSIKVQGTISKLHMEFNAEKQGVSTITIRARDTDDNIADAIFKVELRNKPPEIREQTFYLPENSPAQHLVGTILASDPDGDNPHFQIVSGNAQNLFTLEPEAGSLKVAENAILDYEATPSINLVVAATDDRNPSVENSATIRIYLVNENEAPLISDASYEIGENIVAGQILGPVTGSDPEGNPVTYSIQSGNEDGLFTVDQSGFLSIAKDATLDAIQKPRHTLVIRARDNGSPKLQSDATLRINVLHQLVGGNTELRYLVPPDASLDVEWMKPGFDDNNWTMGKLGIGYDTNTDYDPLLGTDLESAMKNKANSAYARIPFNIPDPASIGNLKLRYLYDDGCILYLNGHKILEINAPQAPAWNSSATGSNEADLKSHDELDLTASIQVLVAGTNILAVHLLNEKTTSSDLLFHGELSTSSAGTPVAPNPSSIESSGAGLVGRTTARPSGRILRTNGEQPTLTLVLDTTDRGKSAGTWARSIPLPAINGETFSINVDQLLPGTTYHYAFHAHNSGGRSWTNTTNTFTTRANQKPSASPEEYTANSGTMLNVPVGEGILANDSDPEGDPLTSKVLASPANGTLELLSDGSFTYSPNPDFTGTDTFTYITSDPYDDAVSGHTWISKGATWKYRDSAIAPGAKWRTDDFNDSGWKSGPAELGYGDNDEKTTLSFGGDNKNKIPTYYFRKSFSLPDGSIPLSASLLLKRDDAAAVYLNGAEVHRDNNLSRIAGHNDFASSNVPDENTYIHVPLDPLFLLQGNNLLTAEVHQSKATSSDLSFDLELTGYLRTETTVTIVVEPASPDADNDGLPDSWEQSHFGDQGATPGDDPDADGLANLLEYALGTDPVTLSRPPGTNIEEPSTTLVNDGGQTYMEFTFRRRKGNTTSGNVVTGYTVDGLTYTIQVSSNLQDWQTGESFLVTTGNPLDNGDGTETVTARLRNSAGDSGVQFVRLQVSTE